MNTLQRLAYPAIALLSLAAAFAAHAESPTIDHTASQVWPQYKTRAAVQADYLQARADGSIKVNSFSYNIGAASKSLRSRDEVLAEARSAEASGAIDALIGEDSGSIRLARLPAARATGQLFAAAPLAR